ncbi:MAG: SDR family NAD(P)-dependent oxidoreductase, partial [Parabacteroides sp.]|nr:SDR family NAD(P)-dependent oxidoreductase [Parabacteroides sp.]
MKYALVTGGSSGIGLEYARQLAEKGYHLVIVSNQEEENRGVAEEIHSCFGVDVRPLYADLSQPDSAEMVYTWCRKQALHIHILISNAGILHFGRLVNAKEEVIDRIVTLHCTTPAKLCRLFAADMSKRHDGHILLMSSMAAWLPYPTISLYGSTKTFLKNFGQALWYELRPYGVCVTTIFPGAVDTPLYQLDEKKRRLLRR